MGGACDTEAGMNAAPRSRSSTFCGFEQLPRKETILDAGRERYVVSEKLVREAGPSLVPRCRERA
jgi:hypothetical protein